MYGVLLLSCESAGSASASFWPCQTPGQRTRHVVVITNATLRALYGMTTTPYAVRCPTRVSTCLDPSPPPPSLRSLRCPLSLLAPRERQVGLFLSVRPPRTDHLSPVDLGDWRITYPLLLAIMMIVARFATAVFADTSRVYRQAGKDFCDLADYHSGDGVRLPILVSLCDNARYRLEGLLAASRWASNETRSEFVDVYIGTPSMIDTCDIA